MENNKKIKFPFWVTPETMETVKEMYKDDDYRSQSEFIEKAIQAYVGYLRADNSPGMLPNYMVSTMKAIVDSSDTRMCRMLFKLAVEMAIMMNILAAHCDVAEQLTRAGCSPHRKIPTCRGIPHPLVISCRSSSSGRDASTCDSTICATPSPRWHWKTEWT